MPKFGSYEYNDNEGEGESIVNADLNDELMPICVDIAPNGFPDDYENNYTIQHKNGDKIKSQLMLVTDDMQTLLPVSFYVIGNKIYFFVVN